MRFKNFLNENYKEIPFKLLGMRNLKEVNKELEKLYPKTGYDNKGALIDSLESLLANDLGFNYGIVFANKIDVFGRYLVPIEEELYDSEESAIIDRVIIYYKSKIKVDPLNKSILSSIEHQIRRIDGRLFQPKFSVIRPGEFKLEAVIA